MTTTDATPREATAIAAALGDGWTATPGDHYAATAILHGPAGEQVHVHADTTSRNRAGWRLHFHAPLPPALARHSHGPAVEDDMPATRSPQVLADQLRAGLLARYRRAVADAAARRAAVEPREEARTALTADLAAVLDTDATLRNGALVFGQRGADPVGVSGVFHVHGGDGEARVTVELRIPAAAATAVARLVADLAATQ